MQIIYVVIALGLMWLHFSGVTALAGPRFGSWAIGRALGILAIVMAGFCVEHLFGLGKLHYVWPFTAAAAAYLLWRDRQALAEKGFFRSEAVFGCAIAYALIWRFLFPSIYHVSERIPDLVFISSYIDGVTLPPVDHWLPPLKFDFYYTLQYYGAALAGRVLNMPLGVTYNMGIVFLSAMAVALLWDMGSRFIASPAQRLLLVAALVVGGTGISMFNHLIVDFPGEIPYRNFMWGSQRFIGEFDQFINTDLGRTLFPSQYAYGVAPRQLGMENFGYQYFLGEYHAPLGGYFLLFLVLALILAMETVPAEEAARKRWLQAGMGFSVPAVLATNTWLFPFQVVLLGSWALMRAWHGRKEAERKPDWLALIGGGIAGFALLYPFLFGFAVRGVSTPIKMVYDIDHTPWRNFLGQFWPLLTLLALGLWNRDTRRLSLFFALVFGGLLIFSELFFVDDPSGDQYERSNTLMKWWGWIWSGGLAALGALLLASKARWVRIATSVALALTLVHVYDIVNFAWHDRERGGSFFGNSLYVADEPTRDMFKYLETAPDGIVVENLYGEGYSPGGVFAAFSGKPLFVGWTNQLYNWRGYMEMIGTRKRDVTQFYSGELKDPLKWLLDNDIRYVVWGHIEAGNRPALWQQRNAELMAGYAWTRFGDDGGNPVGIWVRRDKR